MTEEPSSQEPSLCRLAEEARKLGLWEEAIHHYRKAIQEDSLDSRLPLALGQCYEALAKRKNTNAFTLMAMEQYREAIKRNPEGSAPYDALWAAASRVGQAEELISDLKERLRRDPSNEVLRGAFRRMEALYHLRAVPIRNVRPPLSRALWWLLEVGLPLFSAVFLCVGIVLSWRARAGAVSFAPVFIRTGGAVGVAYCVYKLFLGPPRKRR